MKRTAKQFGNWQQALNYCLQLHQTGKLAEAEEGYRQLMVLQPNEPDLPRLLGLALSQMNRAQEGLPYLQKAVRMGPQNPLALMHLGFVLKTLALDTQAAVYFEKVTRLAPDEPAAYINLAAIYTEQGKHTLAIESARQGVRLAPTMPEAQHNLGLSLLNSGLARESFPPLQQALKLKPEFPEAWMHLGRSYSAMGRYEDATVAYLECLRLAPGHVGGAVNLANVWFRRGYTADAIDLYRQVLSKEPDRWEARLSLASALADEDRFDESLTVIENITPPASRAREVFFQRVHLLTKSGQTEAARLLLDKDKNHDLRYWLTFFDLAQDDAQRTEAVSGIESRLAEPEANIEAKINGAFTLGEHAHSLKDYPRAFKHYSQGHSWLGEIQPYDHATWEQDVESIFKFHQQMCSKNHALDYDNRSPKPLFIVGMPRSGTSLLEQILDCHPDVVGGGELPDIGRIAANLRVKGLDSDRFRSEGTAYLEHLHQLGPQAKWVTDKMPHNFQYIGLIAILFPHARIIHCCRDPRDNALSIWRQRFVGYHAYANDLSNLARHYTAHEMIMMRWKEKVANPIICVKYEDIVANMESQVVRVLKFLELEFEPACLEFHKNPRKVRTASRDQVNKPLYATSLGQWHSYAEQLAPFIQTLQTASS